jgi:hypothetical protein
MGIKRGIEEVLRRCPSLKVPLSSMVDEYEKIFRRHDAESQLEDEEYEVEDVLDEDGFRFLVKWVGYPASESTWEPVDALAGCDELVAEFRRKKQLAKAHGGGQRSEISKRHSPPSGRRVRQQ